MEQQPSFGEWPPGSSDGQAGARGNTIVTTFGDPSDSVGVDGDYAYDPTTTILYGPKAGGWVLPGTQLRAIAIAAQRVQHLAEVLVSTNESDPGGGWGDVIPLTVAQPIIGGVYQVIAGLELAMDANAVAHTAQAQLLIDGVEVAVWQNPRIAYNRCQFINTYLFVDGETPSFQMRLRRFGSFSGSARARRAQILLMPSPVIVEL